MLAFPRTLLFLVACLNTPARLRPPPFSCGKNSKSRQPNPPYPPPPPPAPSPIPTQLDLSLCELVSNLAQLQESDVHLGVLLVRRDASP
jgi:hypothetical protein